MGKLGSFSITLFFGFLLKPAQKYGGKMERKMKKLCVEVLVVV